MATATPPPPVTVGDAGRAAIDRRVRHPLEQLRGVIRLYVAAEGIAVLGIYLALWCWITLALDYGLFQATQLDWAQGVPVRAVRAFMLGGLFAFVLALVGLFRADGSAARSSGQSRRPTVQGIVLLIGMVLMLAAPLVYFILQGQSQLVALLMLTFHLLVMTLVLVFAVVRILHAGHKPLWLVMGGALGVAYVAGWFLVGGLRDFRAANGPLAAVLLIVLAAAPVVYVVVRMLTTIFSDASLALILERRFPKQLGDRLITAVELADSQVASRYGYSQAMIDRTINEAADEVGKLPVNEVFDWNRLVRYGVFVVGLTAGMYVLALGGYIGMNRLTRAPEGSEGPEGAPSAQRPVVSEFVGRSGNLTSIWFERNVLLANTPWPRDAQLELIGFPEEGDLRVGRTAASPSIRVRALRWVVADDNHRDGWRSMLWSDLTPALLKGQPVPDLSGVVAPGSTVDAVELVLSKLPTDKKNAQIDAARVALATLAETTAEPAMQRKVRLFETPDEVKLYYSGQNTSNEITLKRESGNDYIGDLVNLSESVSFTAKTRNYNTPPQTITVVPPPVLIDLVQADERPAYLYHMPFLNAEGKPQDLEVLRGQWHTPPEEKVSLTGDTSVVTVPLGTKVKLTGQIGWLEKDRDLQKLAEATKALIELKTATKKGQPDAPIGTALHADSRSFDLFLPAVTKPYEFELQFTDNDNIVGRRSVRIEVERDNSPDVNVQVDSIIRKVAGGAYMITPFAKVPFVGEVTDDHGLQKLDYVFTLAALDSPTAVAFKAQYAAFTLGLTPLAAPASVHLLGRLVITESEPAPRTAPFTSFRETFARSAPEAVPEAEFRARLKKKPSLLPPLVPRFTVRKDAEGLDLMKLGVADKDPTGVPLRYRMRIWAVATDNNIETGPNLGESKERFTFMVVPVQELLSEIDKEEETLRNKLDQAVRLLRDGRNEKFKDAARELEDAEEAKKVKADPEYAKKFYHAMASQISRVGEQVNSAETSVKEISSDYEKILGELQANLREVMDKDGHPEHEMITRVRGIKQAFDEILAANGPFAEANRTLQDLQDNLDKLNNNPGSLAISRDRLDQLITRMEELLKLLGDLTSYNKILEDVYKLQKDQSAINRAIVAERDRIEKEFLENLLNPKK